MYAGEYAMEGEDHPVVGWFWDLVESMTEAKRAKLLQVKRVLDEFQQCVVCTISMSLTCFFKPLFKVRCEKKKLNSVEVLTISFIRLILKGLMKRQLSMKCVRLASFLGLHNEVNIFLKPS